MVLDGSDPFPLPLQDVADPVEMVVEAPSGPDVPLSTMEWTHLSQEAGLGSVDPHWHLRPESNALDSDLDGFSNAVEQALGTNRYDLTSHPAVVEAHHFPAGTQVNLPDTIDIPR